MAGLHLSGNWKLVESDKFQDFVAAMGMPEDKCASYRELNNVGDGGLELHITTENQVVTTEYRLKGESKHTESFTIGETCDVVGIMGKSRAITSSVDGDAIVCKAKSEKAEVENRIEKQGDQLVMTMTCAGVSTTLKFNLM